MKTLIIYEYPKALPDVLRWAETLKLHEIIENPDDLLWVFTLFKNDEESEHFWILPHNDLTMLKDAMTDVTKVVLWGAFDLNTLQTLTSTWESRLVS